MEKILLNDILNFSDSELSRTKIRLMVAPSLNKANDPLEHYQKNPEKVATEWFLYKQKAQGRPFKVGQLGIGLLNLADDNWLLVTVKSIDSEINKMDSGQHYNATEISVLKKYFGRIVVKYHNEVQQMIRNAKGLIENMEVLEILSSKYEGKDFPGYDKIILSWTELSTIIERQKKDWVVALKNQKAVYLITDTNTGKQYVGSATNDKGMLLDRWATYIDSGSGGNIRLEEIKKDRNKGLDYIQKYFQYSILENFYKNTDDRYILERESWWKDVLRTREFGYNAN